MRHFDAQLPHNKRQRVFTHHVVHIKSLHQTKISLPQTATSPKTMIGAGLRSVHRIPVTCSISSSDDWSSSTECRRKAIRHKQVQRPSDFISELIASVASAALASIVLLGSPIIQSPPPAAAVTNEQLLYLEAWRAVDRAYVDKGFNGQSWFRVREEALKKVPMANREETYSAIRQLLASLDDPFTRFLEPGQYAALR
jgi:hypothetical protein